MSRIESISERASFARKEDELSIVITASVDRWRMRLVGTILLLWLCGGVFIIWNYFGLTDQKAKILTIVWIAFWLYFSYIQGKAFLWLRSGKEIIKLRNRKLLYKRDTGGRGWVNEYAFDSISDLKASEDKSPSWIKQFGGDFWSTDCDSISFESAERTITFGFRLDEKEKERILKLIRKELKD